MNPEKTVNFCNECKHYAIRPSTSEVQFTCKNSDMTIVGLDLVLAVRVSDNDCYSIRNQTGDTCPGFEGYR